MSNPLAQLTNNGVSIWLDDLSRERIESGNLQELIELARKDRLSYASSGIGTTTHLGAELLKREAAAIGPRIHPFDATLRRPAQSLAGQPSEQLLAPPGAANPSV